MFLEGWSSLTQRGLWTSGERNETWGLLVRCNRDKSNIRSEDVLRLTRCAVIMYSSLCIYETPMQLE